MTKSLYRNRCKTIADSHTDRHTDSHTDRHTDRQTYRHTNRQLDRQTNKHNKGLTLFNMVHLLFVFEFWKKYRIPKFKTLKDPGLNFTTKNL